VAERLRGLLLDRADGTSAEMIDAVLALRPHSPLDFAARLDALKVFLLSPDAAVSTALNKRIVNILRKAPASDNTAVQAGMLTEPAEIELYAHLSALRASVQQALAQRDYGRAFESLTGLKDAIDAFFEHVMVMDTDLGRRNNRLALLREVAGLLGSVADLSKLPGAGS